MTVLISLILLVGLFGMSSSQQPPPPPGGSSGSSSGSGSSSSGSTPDRPAAPPTTTPANRNGAQSYSSGSSASENVAPKTAVKWIYNPNCKKWAKVYQGQDAPSLSCPAVFHDPDFSEHQICTVSGQSLYGLYAGSSIWAYPWAYCANLPFIMCPALKHMCQDDTQSTCLTSHPGYKKDYPTASDYYPNNSELRQNFSVPAGNSMEITFEDFIVEAHSTCDYDYVQFSDGNGNLVGEKLCGETHPIPQKFTIITSKASVLFKTDKNISKKGFKFCYKPVSCSSIV